MLSQTQVLDACIRTGNPSLVEPKIDPEIRKSIESHCPAPEKSTSTQSAENTVPVSSNNENITVEEIAKRKRDVEIFKRQIEHFEAHQEAARKKAISKPVKEDMVRFSIFGTDPIESKKEKERLLESGNTEQPYDDVLLPGDYSEEVLESTELKIAVASARERGQKVALRTRNEISPGVIPSIGANSHTAILVNQRYADNKDYTYRDAFNYLFYAGENWGENFLPTELGKLHGKMTSEELCDETLHSILRVDLERLNRLIGIIGARFKISYNSKGDVIPVLPERVQETLAAYDELSEKVWKRAMQFKRENRMDAK